MKLYPAIDIKDGKCVRLYQGRFDDVTVYGDDPAAMAQKWAAQGRSFYMLSTLTARSRATASAQRRLQPFVRR